MMCYVKSPTEPIRAMLDEIEREEREIKEVEKQWNKNEKA